MQYRDGFFEDVWTTSKYLERIVPTPKVCIGTGGVQLGYYTSNSFFSDKARSESGNLERLKNKKMQAMTVVYSMKLLWDSLVFIAIQKKQNITNFVHTKKASARSLFAPWILLCRMDRSADPLNALKHSQRWARQLLFRDQ